MTRLLEKLKDETFQSHDQTASCNLGLSGSTISVKRFTRVNSIYFWRHNDIPVREREAASILDRMEQESIRMLKTSLALLDDRECIST